RDEPPARVALSAAKGKIAPGDSPRALVGEPTMWLAPITLRGEFATLVLLSHDHHDDLVHALQDGELWKLWYTSIPPPDGLAAEIDRRLDLQMAGSMLPFAV